MTSALAINNSTQPQLQNQQQSLAIFDPITMAHHFVKSGFFRDTNDISKAVVKIVLGAEFGLGAVTSMMNVYIVEGKPSMGAHLIGALVRKAGYDYRVPENSNTKCRIVFYDKQHKEMGESIFTIEDATKAQLAGKGNWAKYPKAMLFARAMSQGAKMHCPDATMGVLYTPDELGAEVEMNEAGDIIAVKDITPTAPVTTTTPPHDVLTGGIIEPTKQAQAPTPIKTMITGVQLAEIRRLLDAHSLSEDDLLIRIDKSSLEVLTEKQADSLITKMNKPAPEQEAPVPTPTAPITPQPQPEVVNQVSLGPDYQQPSWAQDDTATLTPPTAPHDDFDTIPSGSGYNITPKQLKALYAIARAEKRLSERETEDWCVERYGVRPSELTKNEASDAIGILKGVAA